jgi:hypothetical protein
MLQERYGECMRTRKVGRNCVHSREWSREFMIVREERERKLEQSVSSKWSFFLLFHESLI